MSLETYVPTTCPCGIQLFVDPDQELPRYPCGCDGQRRRGPAPRDLSGAIFGLWVVVGRLERKPRGAWSWICRCSGCDVLKEVWGPNLLSGMSSGCASCRARGRSDRVARAR